MNIVQAVKDAVFWMASVTPHASRPDVAVVSIPLVYPTGSGVQVFVERNGWEYRVSDGGGAMCETYTSLDVTGAADAVCEDYNLAHDRGEIYSVVPEEGLSSAIAWLALASLTLFLRIQDAEEAGGSA